LSAPKLGLLSIWGPNIFPSQPIHGVRSEQRKEHCRAKGVFIGTSSWKYPGWRGQLYDEERYVTRGKFSESRFNRDCLAEYAEVFTSLDTVRYWLVCFQEQQDFGP